MFLRGEDAKFHQLDHLGIPPLARAYSAMAHGVDDFLIWIGRTYARIIHFALGMRYILLVLFFAGLAATVWIYRTVPTAFIPQEDQGMLMIIIQAPPGASLSDTTSIADRAQLVLKNDPDIVGAFAVTGFSFSGASPNNGMIFAALRPSDQRKGPGHSAAEIVHRLTPQMFMVPGGTVSVFQPPAVQGLGTFGGFQFLLQDSGQDTLYDMDRVAHTIIGASRQSKQLTGLFTSFSAADPQLLVTIDRDKAKAMGVSLTQVASTLGVFMGSQYVNDFDFNNRTYRVYVQADQPFRMTARDLHAFYVRSDTTSQMIPLDSLVTVKDSAGPQVISHYNLFRSVEIDGSPAPGVSSSEAITAMEKLADSLKMPGMSYSWTGITQEEIESSGKAIVIFALGILVVYLTLSAQYESFALPFIILLSVPMAVLGALGAVHARGLADDVYCQIGLVMLIGLAAKNAILIVEFAEQLRAKGRSIPEAAIEAAELRLRPILMTSFAFILGVLPLVFASGAGALGRHSVGTTIVGGMLLSTVLNLIFIPVLYVILSGILASFKPKPATPAEHTA